MSSILADQKALSCMRLNAGGGGVAGSQLYTGVQINFGDLTPYLTYRFGSLSRILMKMHARRKRHCFALEDKFKPLTPKVPTIQKNRFYLPNLFYN
jgi:hypothetical protein